MVSAGMHCYGGNETGEPCMPELKGVGSDRVWSMTAWVVFGRGKGTPHFPSIFIPCESYLRLSYLLLRKFSFAYFLMA